MKPARSAYLMPEMLLAIVLGGLVATSLTHVLIWVHRATPRLDDPAALARADAARTFAAFRSLLARAGRGTIADAPLPDASALPAARWLRGQTLPPAPAAAREALAGAGFTFREEPGVTVFLHAASGAPLGVLTVATEARSDGTWQVVRLAAADDSPRGFQWRHPVGPLLWRILDPSPPHAMTAAEVDLPDPTHPSSRTRYVLPLHP